MQISFSTAPSQSTKATVGSAGVGNCYRLLYATTLKISPRYWEEAEANAAEQPFICLCKVGFIFSLDTGAFAEE